MDKRILIFCLVFLICYADASSFREVFKLSEGKIKLELKVDYGNEDYIELPTFRESNETIDDLLNLELDPDILFENFIMKYDKKYSGEAEKYARFGIFKENLLKYKSLNADPTNLASYGIDHLSDRRLHELTGVLDDPDEYYNTKPAPPLEELQDIPANFDWRKQGVVTRVKNQGFCGSCWTFGACGVIEGAYARKHKKLLQFSEQQILDCDKSSFGCQGGNPISALNKIKKMGGIELEKDYPYEGVSRQCRANPQQYRAQVDKVYTIPQNNEGAIKKYLYSYGPVSITLSSTYFNGYRGGIMAPRSCPSYCDRHAVLLVGYGISNGVPYWIFKNSWGKEWGQNGFGYIYRGYNICGLAEYPVFATVL